MGVILLCLQSFFDQCAASPSDKAGFCLVASSLVLSFILLGLGMGGKFEIERGELVSLHPSGVGRYPFASSWATETMVSFLVSNPWLHRFPGQSNFWLMLKVVGLMFGSKHSGKIKEHKLNLFDLDIFRWGEGFPGEGVGAKKFGTSLEI